MKITCLTAFKISLLEFFSFGFCLIWTVLKIFFEFITILLLFYVLIFGHEACGILALQQGIEYAPPALEGEVLTTGPSGKSIVVEFLN